MDEIDHKLARIDRRLEARRAELHRRLEAAPELGSLLAELKTAFGPLRVEYVEIDGWSHGEPPQRGFVPARYQPPSPSRRGKASALRARERLGR